MKSLTENRPLLESSRPAIPPLPLPLHALTHIIGKIHVKEVAAGSGDIAILYSLFVSVAGDSRIELPAPTCGGKMVTPFTPLFGIWFAGSTSSIYMKLRSAGMN